MRIGILGGSFDPVHNAHLIMANLAREQLALDRVLFVVTAMQPLKPGGAHADGQHRLAMVRVALKSLPDCIADDRELRRGGASFTVDTLGEIAAENPGAELVLLLGADAASRIDQWRDPDGIRRLASIAICDRRDDTIRDPAMIRFATPRLDISSTEIRARAARGASLSGWVPPLVADYIVASQLYRSPAG